MHETVSHLPNQHDFDQVAATEFKSAEEMLQFSKELGQWLVAVYSVDELKIIAERVGSLFWHGVKVNPPYKIHAVDPFGVAVLEAFAEHGYSEDTQYAVDWLRRSKSSALNKPFSHRTVLHEHGPNPPKSD